MPQATLSRMLAERFACRLYSSDETMRDHSARLDPAAAPLLEPSCAPTQMSGGYSAIR